MKILVGWWNPRTTELVDIPSFDLVPDPEDWLPVVVEAPRRLIMLRVLGHVDDNKGVGDGD